MESDQVILAELKAVEAELVVATSWVQGPRQAKLAATTARLHGIIALLGDETPAVPGDPDQVGDAPDGDTPENENTPEQQEAFEAAAARQKEPREKSRRRPGQDKDSTAV